LPVEVARRCYGQDQQDVTLTLAVSADPDHADNFIPTLEISPAPWQDDLTVIVQWPGEEREFHIKKPVSPRKTTASDPGASLPRALLPRQDDAGPTLGVEFRGWLVTNFSSVALPGARMATVLNGFDSVGQSFSEPQSAPICVFM
jgi:hypothetical protein